MLRRNLQQWSQLALSQQHTCLPYPKLSPRDLQRCRMLTTRGSRDSKGSDEMTWGELGTQAVDKIKCVLFSALQLQLSAGTLSVALSLGLM